jgi:hypothetical protein
MMLTHTLLLGATALFAFTPAMAQTGPFDAAWIVADDELDETRGGFMLPNGMDIRLGIAVDTLINGRPALSTVLIIDDVPHLVIYTGGNIQGEGTATEVVVPGPNGPSLVRITQGASFSPAASGGQQIAAISNGAPIATEWGAVQLAQSDNQSTVVLVGDGLELRHMIGRITGALVANTGSDRVIDTNVTIDIDIRNSAIPSSTMMLRLDTLLAGAAVRGGY